MTEAIFKSRRDFLADTLAGSAVALTATALPLSTQALNTRMYDGRPALVLFQQHDVQSRAFADAHATQGFATLALGDDPVRLWRDGLQRLFTEDNVVLLGLSNWADYTMLRLQAAEHRRFPLLEQAQGDKFRWVIG